MILQFLAICGLMFFLKESYIFSKIRNYLIRNSTFFLELFECAFCVGFHCSWIIYILINYHNINIINLIIYCFAGGAISILYYKFLEYLSK
jgi:hypothetical protein